MYIANIEEVVEGPLGCCCTCTCTCCCGSVITRDISGSLNSANVGVGEWSDVHD
ncbi:MAG: hypothetical protein KAU16_06245 [Methanophagales archaeon]|nr:hypothetical protein [Methanophagales archaeon]